MNVCSPKKQYKIFNPPAWDPKSSLPEVWHKWSDHVRHLVYTVWQRHNFERKPQDEWVRLQSVHLKKVLPFRDYAKIMYALEQAGVLECKRNAATGEKIYHFRTTTDQRPGQSAEYRLSPAFRTGWKECQVTNHNLLKKLARLKEGDNRLTTIHQSLKPYFLSAKLDCEKSRAWVNANLPEWEDQCPILDQINQVEQGNTHYKCSQYGRLFTSFTNIKRELRQFIVLQDGPTTEVDLRCSQPFFLSTIMNSWLKTGNLESIKQNANNSVKHSKQPTPLPPPTICGDIFGGTWKEDVDRFTGCCVDGDLYEVLGSHSGRTRQQVKDSLMPLLFGERHWDSWLHETFRKLFHGVLAFIQYVNGTGINALSHYLNVAESNFVYQIVSRHLLLQDDPFPFLTVHDSFLVPTDRPAYIEAVITDLARQTYGYSPKVKHG